MIHSCVFCLVIVVYESFVCPEQLNCPLFFRKILEAPQILWFSSIFEYLNPFQQWLYDFEIHVFTLRTTEGFICNYYTMLKRSLIIQKEKPCYKCFWTECRCVHEYIYLSFNILYYLYFYILYVTYYNRNISEYEYNQMFSPSSSIACRSGFYKASAMDAYCVKCPPHSYSHQDKASECVCERGFYRAETDPRSMACTSKLRVLWLPKNKALETFVFWWFICLSAQLMCFTCVYIHQDHLRHPAILFPRWTRLQSL